MSSRIVAVLSALGLLFALPAHAKGPFGTIQVGNWKGGAYTFDDTGAFSHCAAGTPYKSGIYFMVGMKADNSWILGFAHQSWQLTQGEVIPIDLTFDAQGKFHVFGSPVTSSLLLVPMPNNSALMNQFRKSAQMTAFAKGQLFPFNLDSTSQLLPTLANCVSMVKRNGLNNAGDFGIKLPSKEVAAASSLKPAQPQTQTTLSPELQIEAIELATNFILKSALQNPKVLSRSETPVQFSSFGAAWKSDEAVGAVRIIAPQADLNGIDVAAAVTAGDARACKGKFASGRVSELVDSEVVFRGFASCEDSEGSRTAQYFIVPRKKDGFVMFSVISDMKTEQSRNVTKDEKLTDFRRAALTAVTY
jgi:hypothetical protein